MVHYCSTKLKMNGNEKTWLFLSRRRRFSPLFFASQIHKQQPIFHFLTRHNYLGLPFIFFFAQWIIFLTEVWQILSKVYSLTSFWLRAASLVIQWLDSFWAVAAGSPHCFSHPKFINSNQFFISWLVTIISGFLLYFSLHSGLFSKPSFYRF